MVEDREMNENRLLAITIIMEFEDLLEEKNILIPSDDRVGDESEAAIFGTEYYDLEDRITGILDKAKECH